MRRDCAQIRQYRTGRELTGMPAPSTLIPEMRGNAPEQRDSGSAQQARQDKAGQKTRNKNPE